MSTRVFAQCLLFIVSVVALVEMFASVTHPVRIADSTTRVQNLEVAGTTAATGVVTATAGVKLTSTSGPSITSGTGAPSASAAKGSVYVRTDTAGFYQNTDGATTWGPSVFDTFTSALKGLAPASGGGGTNYLRADGTWAEPPGGGPTGSSSIVIAQNVIASTNLSTNGTVDWLYPTTANPTPAAVNGIHAKFKGGWLYATFHWKSNGTTSLSAQTTTPETYTSTASDDLVSTALNLTSANGWVASGTSATGTGATFSVPVSKSSRVVRIYIYNFACTVTLTATMDDGSATATDSIVSPSNATSKTQWAITYNGADPTTMTINVTTSAALGSTSPSFKIAGITVGT